MGKNTIFEVFVCVLLTLSLQTVIATQNVRIDKLSSNIILSNISQEQFDFNKSIILTATPEDYAIAIHLAAKFQIP